MQDFAADTKEHLTAYTGIPMHPWEGDHLLATEAVRPTAGGQTLQETACAGPAGGCDLTPVARQSP